METGGSEVSEGRTVVYIGGHCEGHCEGHSNGGFTMEEETQNEASYPVANSAPDDEQNIANQNGERRSRSRKLGVSQSIDDGSVKYKNVNTADTVREIRQSASLSEQQTFARLRSPSCENPPSNDCVPIAQQYQRSYSNRHGDTRKNVCYNHDNVEETDYNNYKKCDEYTNGCGTPLDSHAFFPPTENEFEAVSNKAALPPAPEVVVMEEGTMASSLQTMNVSQQAIKKLVRQISGKHSRARTYDVQLEPLASQPKTYFDLALFTFCCCLSPVGFVALLISVFSDAYYKAGNVAKAHCYGRLSLALCILGMVTSLITAVALLMTFAYPWDELSED